MGIGDALRRPTDWSLDALCTGFGFTMNICLAVMCYLLVFAEPVVPFVSGEAFAAAVTPVRIIGDVSLMSCVSYFVAMCVPSPLGRERQMAMSSIAADPVSVALNLLLDVPFGAVDAGVALWPPRRPS